MSIIAYTSSHYFGECTLVIEVQFAKFANIKCRQISYIKHSHTHLPCTHTHILNTEDGQRQALVPLVRNEIVRDIVAHMYSYNPNPSKDLCTQVAEMLVKKYKFMRDVGQKVSGYVS